MKFIAAFMITVCAIVNAPGSCVATLDDAGHNWVIAKVSDIRETKPRNNERQLKLTTQNWVITATATDVAKLSKEDSVQIKQDGNMLSVKTKSRTINCRLICIQKVLFVE
jgi:hypothetical protein